MLLLLLWWALLLAAARRAGAIATATVKTGEQLSDPAHRYLAQVWTGLLVLSSLLLTTSFFVAVRPFISASVLLAVIVVGQVFPPSLRELKTTRLPSADLTALAAILIAAAFNASGPTTYYDTGLYHYPLERWLADVGTVPGIALLHYRFAFSSSWLATGAAVDFGPWIGHTAGVTGGLAFALLVFHFVIATQRVGQRLGSTTDRFLIFALPLLLFVVLRNRQQLTPSPDLAAAAGILCVAWSMIAARRQVASDWNLPLLVAAGVFAVKLSAGPALLIVVLARLMLPLTRRDVAMLVAVSLLLAGPLLVANYITSGCPLFPSSLWCVESPSSLGAAVAHDVANETTNWARYRGSIPGGTTSPTTAWIAAWPWHVWNACFLAAVLGGFWAARRLPTYRWIAVLGLSGSIYVLAAAPNLRFGIGYVSVLLGLVGLALTPERIPFIERWSPRLWPAVAVAVLVADAIAQEAVYRRSHAIAPTPAAFRLLAPPALPTEDLVAERINDVIYGLPPEGTDQCWASQRPCTPYRPAATLHLCRPARGDRGGYCR